MRLFLRKLVVLSLLFFSVQHLTAQQKVTVDDELAELGDPAKLPVYRPGTSLLQVSSYDTTGGNDDGFGGKYSFIRRNADSSLVIFEAHGPGVINRIWTPTPTDDTLDFFIDDFKYSVKFSDLFSGKVQPFVSPLCGREVGGNYCYYPILFQQKCKIVFKGKKLMFHQIQWRTYPAATRVTAFNPSAKSNFTFRAIAPSAKLKKFDLPPRATQTIFEQQTGGRINALVIYPASAFAGASKDARIRITWDGENKPAVNCPVQDFFGFAFGQPSMQSYLHGVRNDTAYCYLPMPFERSAKIEITNLDNKRNISLLAGVNTVATKKSSKEGRLYTAYNHTKHEKHDGPHLLLNAEGQGHYVGTILQSQGTNYGMTIFFEGDDSTVVDGQLTMHGTGSEDYFNGGWYALTDRWDDKFSLPLHGSMTYDIPLARTGGYRLFLSDKIPFNKSIHHSIEHGPTGNDVPGIYTSVAFYYGEKPVESKEISHPQTVYVPDTLLIYPYLTNYLVTGGMNVKNQHAYNTGGISTVFEGAGESSVRFNFDNIPEGDYELFLDYDKLPEGAKIRLMQRQAPVTEWMDTYSTGRQRMILEKVGTITRTPFTRTLTAHFKTETGRNQFFLNRIILVRKK